METRQGELKILSINVNRLIIGDEADLIFRYLSAMNNAIILLQETHACIPEHISKFRQVWPGQNFWNLGTQQSCGVAILINPKYKLSVNWRGKR